METGYLRPGDEVSFLKDRPDVLLMAYWNLWQLQDWDVRNGATKEIAVDVQA